MIALALTSDILDAGEVYSYADSVVAEKLSQIDGVAKVFVSGAERGAVRIRVDPGAIANMQLSLEQIRVAVAQASQNLPKGIIAIGEQSFAVGANDQLFKAADYRDLIVA